jgi:hypothetical protein
MIPFAYRMIKKVIEKYQNHGQDSGERGCGCTKPADAREFDSELTRADTLNPTPTIQEPTQTDGIQSRRDTKNSRAL